MEHIKLYVIDTTLFPPQTFIRDLDLINAFATFDGHPRGRDLKDMQRRRTKTGYYFGEYFSQGSLRIANKCQVVLAKLLFAGDKLRCLQPHLGDIHSMQRFEKPDLANDVRKLRNIIWPNGKPFSTMSGGTCVQMGIVDEISNLFDPGWRLLMAVQFAALISQDRDPGNYNNAHADFFFTFFRFEKFFWYVYYSSSFVGVAAKNLTRIVHSIGARRIFDPSDYATACEGAMPELARVATISREIYLDIRLRKAQGQ